MKEIITFLNSMNAICKLMLENDRIGIEKILDSFGVDYQKMVNAVMGSNLDKEMIYKIKGLYDEFKFLLKTFLQYTSAREEDVRKLMDEIYELKVNLTDKKQTTASEEQKNIALNSIFRKILKHKSKKLADDLIKYIEDPELLLKYVYKFNEDLPQEKKEIIKKDPKSAYYYAAKILGKGWNEAEPYIKQSPKWWKKYQEFISGLLPYSEIVKQYEIEEEPEWDIKEDVWMEEQKEDFGPEEDVKKLKEIIPTMQEKFEGEERERATEDILHPKKERKLPDIAKWNQLKVQNPKYAEDISLKFSDAVAKYDKELADQLLPYINNAMDLYLYIINFSVKLPKDKEELIKKNPYVSTAYANLVLKQPWPDAEPYMLQNQDLSHAIRYARDVKGRWPELEEKIISNPRYASQYAQMVIGGRWIEAEPYIKQDDDEWQEYEKKLIENKKDEENEDLYEESSDFSKNINIKGEEKNMETQKIIDMLSKIGEGKFKEALEIINSIDSEKLNDELGEIAKEVVDECATLIGKNKPIEAKDLDKILDVIYPEIGEEKEIEEKPTEEEKSEYEKDETEKEIMEADESEKKEEDWEKEEEEEEEIKSPKKEVPIEDEENSEMDEEILSPEMQKIKEEAMQQKEFIKTAEEDLENIINQIEEKINEAKNKFEKAEQKLSQAK